MLAATSVMTVLSGFVIAPPFVVDQTRWYRFGVFSIAVLSGLWWVPMRVWATRRFLWRWWTIAACSSVCSCCAFLSYSLLMERYTVNYFRDQRIVKGWTLTPEAARDAYALRSDGSEVDDLRLLRNVDGNPYDVWIAHEIDSRKLALICLYLGSLLLLSSTIITVSQATYCSSEGQDTRKDMQPNAEDG